MSRSSYEMDTYGKNDEISLNQCYEGTAARTRPYSYDEIMSNRKNMKLSENQEVGGKLGVESGGNFVDRLSDHNGSDRDANSPGKSSAPSAQPHLVGEQVKDISAKKEEHSFAKDNDLAKLEDGKTRHSVIHYKDHSPDVKHHTSEENVHPIKKEEKVLRKDRYLGKHKNREIHDSEKHSKNHSPSVQQHLPKQHVRVRSGRRGNNTSMEDRHLSTYKDRDVLDLETKLAQRLNKDLRADAKSENNEKNHVRRRRDEWPSQNSENENSKKHPRDLVDEDRPAERPRLKSKIESIRNYQNRDDETNRDKNDSRVHEPVKLHNSDTSERKERKETSKSHKEELRIKRRRSRSRERGDRGRRSISTSPRAHRHVSYHGKVYGAPSTHFQKGRSGREYSDTERSKMIDNGSSSHYRRHGGSKSGLGGYSPRKRRSEAAVRTPSPTKQSPEKKKAKWDLAPKEGGKIFPDFVSSNLPLSNQNVLPNTHEVVGLIPIISNAVAKPLSEVSAIASQTFKDSIDSVQLTQATRPRRRLYVENIPSSASEKAVMECLNNYLISSGVNHIPGSQPCISCIINKEKGQALVEFLTPEDASAALSFDGSSFSGSIVKIRRPKDFVQVTTGEPEKSTLVEQSVAAVDSISDTVKCSPQMIFVGGISKILTSKMLMEIASAFGPLKAYQFVNGEDLSKPYAFLEYADHSISPKACAGLDGMKLGGQVITAVQVAPQSSSLEESDENYTFHGIPAHAKPLLEKPTQVLKLKNMIDPEALSWLTRTEIEETLEDVRLECERHGCVISVKLVEFGASSISTLEACEVIKDTGSVGGKQDLQHDEKRDRTETIKETIDQNIMEGNSIDDDQLADHLMENEPCQSSLHFKDMAVKDLAVNSLSGSQELPKQHCSNDDKSIVEDPACGSISESDSRELPQPQCTSYDELSGNDDKDKVLVKEPSCEGVYESQQLPEQRRILNEELDECREHAVDNIEKEAVIKDEKSTAEEELTLEEAGGECEEGFTNDTKGIGSDAMEKGCNLELVFEPGSILVEFRRSEASCIAAHSLHGRLYNDRVVMVEYVPLDLYQAKFPK